MRVLLINDSSSNPNWGDRAAAYSLKAMIEAVGGEITDAVSELELGTSTFGRPVSTAPTAWSAPGPQSAARRLLTQCAPPILLSAGRRAARLGDRSRDRIPQAWPGFAVAAGRFARAGGPWARFVTAVESADVAVIHGDGCMTGNGLIARTELLMAYVIKKHFGKPAIIVNHTGDFSHPALRSIAQEVYPLIDDVAFREPVSVEQCRPFCAGRFAPDTAFWFRPAQRAEWLPIAGRPGYFDVWPDLARFDPTKPYVCVGGSSLFGTGDAGPTLVEDYRQLVEHLRSIYQGQIVLTISDLKDEPILRGVGARLGLPVAALTTPIQQAVDLLGNSDCYVGGRWHAAIFALTGGAPVVALSARTFKMQALAAMAGLPVDLFDAWALRGHATLIGRRVLEYLDQGAALRDRLRTWSAAQAAAAWENVAYLKNWSPA